MFTKKLLLEEVNRFKCQYPGTNPILMFGSSLVMHGIKDETTDIDVYLDKVVALLGDKLSSKSITRSDGKSGTHYELGPFDFGFGEECDVKCVEIDGILCQDLEEILRAKKRWGRQKDLDDIEMINKFLNR